MKTIYSVLTLVVFVMTGCGGSSNKSKVIEAGVFNTPVGDPGPGPATPGKSYSFSFSATEGQKLTFATMYVQSNDLFFAPNEKGIDLFPNGTALNEDITDQVVLLDAGTEADELVSVGPNQAPRQAGANTGAVDSNNSVRLVDDNHVSMPTMVADDLQVLISNDGSGNFIVTVNVLGTSNTPLAPGVFAVFTGSNPIFKLGRADKGEGLMELAEDGNASILFESLSQ